MRIKALIVGILISWVGFQGLEAASLKDRFFLSGDGVLKIVNAKNGAGGKIVYRTSEGEYLEASRKQINSIFGIDPQDSQQVDLRLISLLDYLQDHLKGGTIRVVSGYRSPEYNEGLRQKGGLAAKTSLHLEGMAADINMDGVIGRKLWNFVRSLNCCGAGYYHGKGIHVDTGPSRFWDEKTTKVEQNLGAHNKLLLLRTEFDRYQPGEVVKMGIYRVTDYPFGIRQKDSSPCQSISKKEEARKLQWEIPHPNKEDKKVLGKMIIPWELCEKNYPEMPDQILSNPILVLEEKKK